MQLIKDSKRLGLAIALSFAMLALCITSIHQSHGVYGPRMNANGAKIQRIDGSVSHPTHGKHPIPWAKIVVAHAVSIASYFAA
jgi:hypothetical protein